VILAVVETLCLGYYGYLVVTDQFTADRRLLGLVPLVAVTVAMLLNVINLSKIQQEQHRRGS